MRLTFEKFDGRREAYEPITDQDTGKQVGYFSSNGVFSGGGINVSLFDGKYGITVNSYGECCGFVRGVEAVLNHMVELPDLAQPDLAKSQAA